MRLERCDVLLRPGSESIALLLRSFDTESWITVAQSGVNCVPDQYPQAAQEVASGGGCAGLGVQHCYDVPPFQLRYPFIAMLATEPLYDPPIVPL
jgi:hypothetical protein